VGLFSNWASCSGSGFIGSVVVFVVLSEASYPGFVLAEAGDTARSQALCSALYCLQAYKRLGAAVSGNGKYCSTACAATAIARSKRLQLRDMASEGGVNTA
jgi:hypothetical protein